MPEAITTQNPGPDRADGLGLHSDDAYRAGGSVAEAEGGQHIRCGVHGRFPRPAALLESVSSASGKAAKRVGGREKRINGS